MAWYVQLIDVGHGQLQVVRDAAEESAVVIFFQKATRMTFDMSKNTSYNYW